MRKIYTTLKKIPGHKIKRVLRRLYRIYKSALYPFILYINKNKEPAMDKNRNKRTVKVLYCSKRSNLDALKRQFNTEKGWGNIEFTTNKYADYYLIVNHPLNSPFSYYNPERTLLYYAEPSTVLRRFGKWGNANEKDFFHVSKIPGMITVWYLSKSYHWLKKNPIRKTKILSTITSDLNIFPTHKKRFQFVKLLDKKISIDIYGRIYRFNSPLKTFSNYLGELPTDMQKDEGLFPYQYHFASENTIEDNYISEKLTDAILAECLCFYSGTETAKDRIDSRAFIHIDITKPDEAINMIKEAIENNEWKKRIQIIRREKQKILDEMQLLADIERVINSKDDLLRSQSEAD